MTKLKQVCNHPAHCLRDGSRLAGRSGKLARLEEILEEVLAAGEKALLFTQYAEFGAHAARAPGRRGSAARCCSCTAAWPRPTATRWSPASRPTTPASPPLFVLSLKAGGTGLTLTAANHVVHVDRWWNPAVEDQATDRAFRIGQRRNVQVRKFVCAGTVEEKIAAMIQRQARPGREDRRHRRAVADRAVHRQLRELFALEAGAVVRVRRLESGRGVRAATDRAVEGGLKARSARGAIGESWWSRRFLDVLESFALGGRLARGRNYARPGQVLSLDVAPGVVRATVQGSRPEPYAVSIGLAAVRRADLGRGRDRPRRSRRCSAPSCWPARCRPSSRRSSPRPGAPLFPPAAGELRSAVLAAPTGAVPCKHLAATFYLLAEAFDDDPFLILRWRGRDRETLLGRLRELRADGAPAEATRRRCRRRAPRSPWPT